MLLSSRPEPCRRCPDNLVSFIHLSFLFFPIITFIGCQLVAPPLFFLSTLLGFCMLESPAPMHSG